MRGRGRSAYRAAVAGGRVRSSRGKRWLAAAGVLALTLAVQLTLWLRGPAKGEQAVMPAAAVTRVRPPSAPSAPPPAPPDPVPPDPAPPDAPALPLTYPVDLSRLRKELP